MYCILVEWIVMKDLSSQNSFRLPCRVLEYKDYKDEGDLYKAVEYSKRKNLEVIPLGGMTNVILPSEWNVMCLHIQSKGIEVYEEGDSSVVVRCAAGENWHLFVEYCLENGWYGLENLALIPGSVGAAPVQNIGAYGKEVKDFIKQVKVFDIKEKKMKTLTKKECNFSYRNSRFKDESVIVTEVIFELSKKPILETTYTGIQSKLAGISNPAPRDVFDAVCALRREKLHDPSEIGNVGSFFHNPTVTSKELEKVLDKCPEVSAYPKGNKYRLSAAYLIEKCGWKGKGVGGVGVSPSHSLYIVNKAGGSKEDVVALSKNIQRDVKERFNITLNIEPRIY